MFTGNDKLIVKVELGQNNRHSYQKRQPRNSEAKTLEGSFVGFTYLQGIRQASSSPMHLHILHIFSHTHNYQAFSGPRHLHILHIFSHTHTHTHHTTQLPGFFRPQAPAHTAYIHIYTLNFFLYWRKELNLFWLNGSRRMRVRYDK